MTQDSHADAGPSKTLNPYATDPTITDASFHLTRLNIPSWTAIVCCAASLGFWLLALIASLPYGHPDAPPLIGLLGFIGMFVICPVVGLFGSFSMLQRKRYGWCVAAACCMMIPLLGPCFGFTLPIGIWTLVLLRRQPIRDSFSRSFEQQPSTDFDNADEAIAAAFKLDREGEWDAAIALYRLAAARWPEHARYLHNCIEDIAKKQAAANEVDESASRSG